MLSPDFSKEALNATFQARATLRDFRQTIQRGYPFNEAIFLNEVQRAEDYLTAASIFASNDADRAALQQVGCSNARTRAWIQWFAEEDRNRRTGQYYVTPRFLDEDPRFQDAVRVAESTILMLSSRRLSDDAGCRE